jgi:hypothetical protein
MQMNKILEPGLFGGMGPSLRSSSVRGAGHFAWIGVDLDTVTTLCVVSILQSLCHLSSACIDSSMCAFIE